MKKMLVLYRELAGYFVTCINYMAANHDIQIDIVAWPVNPSAPFRFEFHSNIRILEREEMNADDIDRLIRDQRYDLIFCGGWSDKEYLDVVRRNRGVPSLMGFDKQWLGSMRDWAATAYLRLTVTPHFDFAFVPGFEQHQFARMMGFNEVQIVDGAYACDVDLYTSIFESRRRHIGTGGPRKMWFGGRYVHEKCVLEMFREIGALLDGPLSDWELHCIGTGPLWDQRLIHPKIFHHGFRQASELPGMLFDGELFVLPSRYEPWGIVVHEFAMAGFPLVLSDKIGGRTSFLEDRRNGMIFHSEDWGQFRECMVAMGQKSPSELLDMGARSHNLAMKVTPQTWSDSLLKMMEKGRS